MTMATVIGLSKIHCCCNCHRPVLNPLLLQMHGFCACHHTQLSLLLLLLSLPHCSEFKLHSHLRQPRQYDIRQ